MRKTAEQILKANTIVFQGNVEGPISEVTTAMREFAAQEVEAYKERIKSEIGERITNDNHDSCAQAFDSGLHTALTIIDTVK